MSHALEQVFLAFEARDWARARTHFHDDAVLEWPVTSERFEGADHLIHVNRAYPEGWRIELDEATALVDGRLLVRARVLLGADTFFVTSIATVRDGRIALLREWWSTAEAPPAWRVGLPGARVLPRP